MEYWGGGGGRGQRVCWPPSQIIGGLPPPLFLRLCVLFQQEQTFPQIITTFNEYLLATPPSRVTIAISINIVNTNILSQLGHTESLYSIRSLVVTSQNRYRLRFYLSCI